MKAVLNFQNILKADKMSSKKKKHNLKFPSYSTHYNILDLFASVVGFMLPNVLCTHQQTISTTECNILQYCGFPQENDFDKFPLLTGQWFLRAQLYVRNLRSVLSRNSLNIHTLFHLTELWNPLRFVCSHGNKNTQSF